jgi:hypothetical protein
VLTGFKSVLLFSLCFVSIFIRLVSTPHASLLFTSPYTPGLNPGSSPPLTLRLRIRILSSAHTRPIPSNFSGSTVGSLLDSACPCLTSLWFLLLSCSTKLKSTLSTLIQFFILSPTHPPFDNTLWYLHVPVYIHYNETTKLREYVIHAWTLRSL